MPRYFVEVSYKGTQYSGFQVQENANSIQAEVEKALKIYYRNGVELTGSSRTDAGVHAAQNYFHFDSASEIADASYHLNAILPADIVIQRIFEVPAEAHCRFDALSREYVYTIYQHKNPFLEDRAYFYPFAADLQLLQSAAEELQLHTDFASFSKRNTQVKTTLCTINKSFWENKDGLLTYHVNGNRFLRGMVRGLVGTMLRVGRGKITLEQFRGIIESQDCSKADFAVPPQGLMLMKVNLPAYK
ncbi:MAG: tRNA pseudouridine(38-40) synthase TruA [Bacteroidetes bacterium]|nr:tRNA pseudouridine(38-40) synthase TruA [Bacteroidota bacterium]